MMKIKNKKTGQEIIVTDSNNPDDIYITDEHGNKYSLEEWIQKKKEVGDAKA